MIEKIFKQPEHIYNLIKLSLDEDIGSGDITTNALIPINETAAAYITAKEPLVLAGIDITSAVFLQLDADMECISFFKDGDRIKCNESIMKISGRTRALLTGERTALNFLQKLSGIATATSRYADIIKDYRAEIIDTRKTTPVYRELEKYAVRCGGGKNHRSGLFDMVMIKDNHIRVYGGIKNCVEKIKKSIRGKVKIEVEVKNLEELMDAINCDVDIIMLDNMGQSDLKKAVEITDNRVLLEASGGVTLEKVVDIAETGVDLISVGALTHSSKNADISMNIV